MTSAASSPALFTWSAIAREARTVWQIDERADNRLRALYLGVGKVDEELVRAVSVSFDLVARAGKVVRTLPTE